MPGPGTNIGKLALQFSVANSDIPTSIVGIADPERIVENIRQIEEPMDEEALAGVLQILHPIHNLAWPSGRP